MEREVALTTLKTALVSGTVAAKDKEFTESLVRQCDSRGLSEKQWYWVVRLATALVAVPATVADFSRVYAMFRSAKEHLLHPKVHLVTESGLKLKLYVSTARSRVPDTVRRGGK